MQPNHGSMAEHGSRTFSFPLLSQFIPRSRDGPAMAQQDAPASQDTANNAIRREDRPVSPFLRQVKQFGFFMAGAGFLAASVAVTRRSIGRKKLEMFPAFYISNRNPVKVTPADRQALAAQALGLATLNVMSFGIMLVGGISWGFNLSSVEELRQRTRMALTRPSGMSEEDEKEAEKQLQDLMDGLMSKLGMKKPDAESEEPPSGKDGEGQ